VVAFFADVAQACCFKLKHSNYESAIKAVWIFTNTVAAIMQLRLSCNRSIKKCLLL